MKRLEAEAPRRSTAGPSACCTATMPRSRTSASSTAAKVCSAALLQVRAELGRLRRRALRPAPNKINQTLIGAGYVDDCFVLPLNYITDYTYSRYTHDRSSEVMLQLGLRTIGQHLASGSGGQHQPGAHRDREGELPERPTRTTVDDANMTMTATFSHRHRLLSRAGCRRGLAARRRLGNARACTDRRSDGQWRSITDLDIEQRIKLDFISTHKQSTRQEVVDELINEHVKIKEAKRFGVDLASPTSTTAYGQMSRRMRIPPISRRRRWRSRASAPKR